MFRTLLNVAYFALNYKNIFHDIGTTFLKAVSKFSKKLPNTPDSPTFFMPRSTFYASRYHQLSKMSQSIVDFTIIAFAIFMVVKAMNTLQKKKEEKPEEPPKPSNEEVLLTEIRDILKQK